MPGRISYQELQAMTVENNCFTLKFIEVVGFFCTPLLLVWIRLTVSFADIYCLSNEFFFSTLSSLVLLCCLMSSPERSCVYIIFGPVSLCLCSLMSSRLKNMLHRSEWSQDLNCTKHTVAKNQCPYITTT